VTDTPISSSDLISLRSQVHRRRDAALESSALQSTVQFTSGEQKEAVGDVTAVLVIQPLERVAMQLRCSGGALRDVHIYEVYWAPFTEGAVTLRDVIQFLLSAGINGIKNALGAGFGAGRSGKCDTSIYPYKL
jgi:hypothetical protein